MEAQILGHIRTCTNCIKTASKHARAQVPLGSNNWFLSWNGGAMKSGVISDKLHKLWLNAGNFDRLIPKICHVPLCTIVRKSISTGIHTSNMGKYQEAAYFMAQLENSIFYVRVLKVLKVWLTQQR